MKPKSLCKKISTNIKELFFSFKSEDGLDETFEPWSAKKAGILTKYTTSEKLSITTSFLSSADKEKSKSIMIK